MICPHCGKEHPDEAVFCPSTGRSISKTIVCPHCGDLHPPDMQFCPKTGETLLSQQKPTKPKRKLRSRIILPLILLLLIGAVGVWSISNNLIENPLPSLVGNTTATLVDKLTKPSPTFEPSLTLSPITSPTTDRNMISTLVASTVDARLTQSALSYTATFIAPPLTTYKTYDIPLDSRYIEGMAVIDINGDGRDELAVLTKEQGEEQNGQLTIYEWNISDFNIIWQSDIIDGYPYGLQTCDINFDGRLDILASISGVRLFSNRDHELYDEGVIINEIPDETFVCSDLNGDQVVDLAFGQPFSEGGFVRLYEQGELLKFDNRGEWMGTNGNNMVKPLLIVPGSVFPSVLSGELYSGDVFVYQNNGNFNFVEVFKYQFNERIFGIETTDFDSDGFEDFVVSKARDKIYFFRNQNGEEFDINYADTTNGTFFNLLAYDLTSDSKMDLIAAEFNGKIYLYENLGDFQFREIVSQVSVDKNYGLVVGDFDGDNQPDLVFGQNPVKVVFNAIASFK